MHAHGRTKEKRHMFLCPFSSITLQHAQHADTAAHCTSKTDGTPPPPPCFVKDLHRDVCKYVRVYLALFS